MNFKNVPIVECLNFVFSLQSIQETNICIESRCRKVYLFNKEKRKIRPDFVARVWLVTFVLEVKGNERARNTVSCLKVLGLYTIKIKVTLLFLSTSKTGAPKLLFYLGEYIILYKLGEPLI